MRQSQFPHGAVPFLGDNNETKTICKDCGIFILAQLGHPQGIRCEACHKKFLDTIRERKKHQ